MVKTQLDRRIQGPTGVDPALGGAVDSNDALVAQLGQLGAIDTGAVEVQRDLRQHSLAVQLASALISKRKEDTDKVIESLAK